MNQPSNERCEDGKARLTSRPGSDGVGGSEERDGLEALREERADRAHDHVQQAVLRTAYSEERTGTDHRRADVERVRRGRDEGFVELDERLDERDQSLVGKFLGRLERLVSSCVALEEGKETDRKGDSIG